MTLDHAPASGALTVLLVWPSFKSPESPEKVNTTLLTLFQRLLRLRVMVSSTLEPLVAPTLLPILMVKAPLAVPLALSLSLFLTTTAVKLCGPGLKSAAGVNVQVLLLSVSVAAPRSLVPSST